MELKRALLACTIAAFSLPAIPFAAAQESLPYSFSAPGCSAQPDSAPVFDAKGDIYGTCKNSSGDGFVYELSPKSGGIWTEQVIYTFGSGGSTAAGSGPNGVIFDAKQVNLYGTTSAGGAEGSGVVYELSPNGSGGWTDTLLYSFGTNGANDGNAPMGSLAFDTAGNLYGTTSGGGANFNSGSVFELSPPATSGGVWTEKVIYSFSFLNSGGSAPQNGLILDSKGNLYGTTNGGAGTVFELSPAAGGTWSFQVIGTFASFSNPAGNLVRDSNGNLYGASTDAGTNSAGAVYEWSPGSGGTWTQQTIYSFGQLSTDGTAPLSGLTLGPKGVLFGATSTGGKYSGTASPAGYGTIFELIPGTIPWTEKILYDFNDPSNHDAFHPETGLTLDAAGNIYGSGSGGVNDAGAVFELTSPTTVELPEFSPAPGTYIQPQSVEIADPTLGAIMYYTTNGTTPTTSSNKYTGAITVAATETIEAIGVASGLTNSPVASATYTITPPAATPEFSPAAGSYPSAQKVSITDGTAGAVIYYTTNGATPTTSSTTYTGAITVAATVTIKAVAIATSYSLSNVGEAAYTIETPAATPVIAPAAGTYATTQSVTIKDATSGATIYYTTNSTAPTTSSTKYTAAITVSSSETIEAIAVAPGYDPSAVTTAKYIITPPAATPVFSPAAGRYATAQKVTITDATSGATIYYTTNGTLPTISSTKYSGAITVSVSQTIEAIAVASGYSTSPVGTAAYTIETAAATPVFSPAGGSYVGSINVTITDATPNAVVYYTTNGTTPTTSSTQYTSAVSVAASETLEAIAVASGYLSSALATAKYTITPLPWEERVLHRFGANSTDGKNSYAGLIFDSKGNLYGTTEYGGQNSAGTVFQLTPTTGGGWTESVLYNFGATGADGNDPVAGLIIDSKGNLYTATFHGGANGGGSVVELSPTTSGPWTEKVIYSFGSFSGDGRLPEAGLALDANGNLYGTTTWGGKYGTNASNGGTVFELTPNSSGSWKETVLYNFGSSSTDGMAPTAGPILDSAGNVYTTTTQGGAKGQGTVFEVTPVTGGSWTGKILYSFGTASSDGATPLGGLVFDGVGNLYGTNYSAGAHGYGTVFELSSATGGKWTEKILYSFGATSTDGRNPNAGMIFDPRGNLYSTTNNGGAVGSSVANNGTVFELQFATSVPWPEKVLYSFGTSSTATAADGAQPFAGLVMDPAGDLYGTTALGGASSGVAYELETTTVATPLFSIPTGVYAPGQSLKISEGTPGATIYYTTNGATPSTASTKYTAAFSISATETVKAIAVAAAYTNSPVASATYTIEKATATPVITPASGTYTSAQTITISDVTAGAAIYYTTNGATPTTASTKYTAAFKLTASATVKAIAAASGYSPSAVASSAYTIEAPAATPSFSPAAGTYTAAQSVKITDATTGATIYFTTNGTTPTTESTQYTAPVSVAKTTTIEAIAVAAEFTQSAVATGSFTITPPPATITLTPKTLAFPNTTTGTVSAPIAVTVANTGAGAVSLTSISLTGTSPSSFEQLNNCGSSLSMGASCTVFVSFKPAASGTKTATLGVADNATGSPQTAALSGIGIAADPVTLSPNSLTFAATVVGHTSEAQIVTLTNTGTATLNIDSIAITGSNATSFSQLSTCGTTLAPAANCVIDVAFRPTAAGALTGSLTITDSGASSPQTVKLSGTGMS